MALIRIMKNMNIEKKIRKIIGFIVNSVTSGVSQTSVYFEAVKYRSFAP